jgi:hypothetical protein
MSPELTPRDRKEVDGESFKGHAEALNVHSWTSKKAKAPLRLNFEVDGLTAAWIRLSAAVSGLSEQEVARRFMMSQGRQSRDIWNFTENFFRNVAFNPTNKEIQAVTGILVAFVNAGHLKGYNSDHVLIAVIAALTGKNRETARKTLESARKKTQRRGLKYHLRVSKHSNENLP